MDIKVRPQKTGESVDILASKHEATSTQRNSMEIPTHQALLNQLTEHFDGKRSTEEIQELEIELHKAFENMMKTASGKDSIMARYMPQPPHLIIAPYPNNIVMFDRNLNLSRYSTIRQYVFKKNYLITIAYSINQISLAYINENVLSFSEP